MKSHERLGLARYPLWAAAVFCACTGDRARGVPAAADQAAPTTSTSASHEGGVERYLLSGQNTRVDFVGASVTSSHEGRFEVVELFEGATSRP